MRKRVAQIIMSNAVEHMPLFHNEIIAVYTKLKLEKRKKKVNYNFTSDEFSQLSLQREYLMII